MRCAYSSCCYSFSCIGLARRTMGRCRGMRLCHGPSWCMGCRLRVVVRVMRLELRSVCACVRCSSGPGLCLDGSCRSKGLCRDRGSSTRLPPMEFDAAPSAHARRTTTGAWWFSLVATGRVALLALCVVLREFAAIPQAHGVVLAGGRVGVGALDLHVITFSLVTRTLLCTVASVPSNSKVRPCGSLRPSSMCDLGQLPSNLSPTRRACAGAWM